MSAGSHVLALASLALFTSCGNPGAPSAATAAQPGGLQLVERQEGASLFHVTRQGAPLVTVGATFWGPAWAWQGTEVSWAKAGEGALKCEGLGVAGPIKRSGSGRAITYSFDLRAAKATPGAIGGCLIFSLDQSAADRMGGFKAPVLEGRAGFSWAAPGGGTLKVSFDPPMADLGFEQGRPTEIRAWIYKDSIAAGAKPFRMTVTLPEGGGLGKTLEERYGPANPAAWLSGALDPERAFVDLSFLNQAEAPAGKRGFVAASGDGLKFADGTPARFWGANVQAYSLFVQDRAKIDAQVRRLSALGFNLVRLHHHDSAAWVIPSLIKPGDTSQALDEQALDTYFYWIAKLKEAGIYVFIDLHTGRPFREGDAIPGWEDLAKQKGPAGAEAKGFTHVNPRLQELMRKFSRDLLSRVNPHTRLALKDDPAVAGILLTNENDVTHHFGNALLGDKGVPHHNRLFEQLARTFAHTHKLDPNAVTRTWEPGPSKRFLNDLEFKFSRQWIDDLRKLGVKAPIIAGHQWGSNPMFSLPALLAGDVVDAHGYDQGEWIDADPRARSGMMQWLAASQAEGRPFFITEYNTEDAANARDPFTLPLHIAAIGALQGWDAPMLYGYSQDGIGLGPGGMWSSYTHPGVMGVMPAAALAFRRGDVRPAQKTIRFAPSEKDLLDTNLTPDSSLLLRTAPERHKLVISLPAVASLPWIPRAPGQGEVVSDPQRSFVTEEGAIASDTGEIRRDFARGIQTIDTPLSQAVQGWIGGQTVRLGAFEVACRTPKATIAFSSLDGKPLASSQRILVTAVARVERVGGEYKSEPVEAIVRHSGKGLKAYPVRPDGSLWAPIALADGRLSLGAASRTHWHILAP